MEHIYYKKPKIQTFLDISIITFLVANIVLFIIGVYLGRWTAMLNYGVSSFLAVTIHWVYTKHYPEMEELSKEIHQIKEDISRHKEFRNA